MKALIINPPNVPFSSKGILIEPIDVLVTASFVAVLGHEVRLLDMDVRQIRPEDFKNHMTDFAYDIAIIIYDYHIPLHCDGTLEAVRNIADQARARGAKVIVGGKTATYKPEQLLFSGTPVDVLIRHEMELALSALLAVPTWSQNSLKQIPGICYLDGSLDIHVTDRPSQPFDLDTLPIAKRSLVDLDAYIDVRTILSSRGCHMKCDFCHVPGFWGNWRGRSAGAIANEIEYLVNECGAKKILFLDDNATVGRKRMKDICEELIARKIKVAMGCLGSLNLFEEEMMETMHEAGFRWIHYGVESGDDRLLNSIHKKVNADDVRRIVNRTREMGFRVRTSWIMDLPGSTEDELQRTADLILELRTEEVRLHHLAIRMGSRIYEDYSDIPSTQYIHQGMQNQNLAKVSSERVREAVEGIAAELSGGGYAVVRHPDEFMNVEALRYRTPNMNVVSLCPLRYGLGWEY